MGDGGTDLTLDVVTDDRQSSIFKLLGPLWGAGDEYRKCVNETATRIDSALCVVLGCGIRSNRQVAHHNVNACRLQGRNNIYRLSV